MLNEVEEVSVQLGPSKSAQLLSESDSEDEGKESELNSDEDPLLEVLSCSLKGTASPRSTFKAVVAVFYK